jgi:hypothetical protein
MYRYSEREFSLRMRFVIVIAKLYFVVSTNNNALIYLMNLSYVLGYEWKSSLRFSVLRLLCGYW